MLYFIRTFDSIKYSVSLQITFEFDSTNNNNRKCLQVLLGSAENKIKKSPKFTVFPFLPFLAALEGEFESVIGYVMVQHS